MLKVIKFYGTWCGPCKVLAPQFDKAAENNPEIKFLNVDVDNDEDGLAAKFGVMGVPTVLFVKDDKVVDRFAGFRPAEQIEEIALSYV